MDKNYALSIPPSEDFNAYINAALDNNEISLEEWYELSNIYYTKCYLSQDNPRAQSKHRGDEFHYLYSHLPIIEAINNNGTFCDIGCANGHLVEMIHKWISGTGFDIQMYGVDISEGLIELAKKRLPKWKEQFFVGNAHYWKPEKKFDYIHIRGESVEYPYTGPKALNYIRIVEHYMENYLVDGGRFIIGPYWYEHEDNVVKGLFKYWGYSPTGYSEKTHYNKSNVFRKVIWIDKT